VPLTKLQGRPSQQGGIKAVFTKKLSLNVIWSLNFCYRTDCLLW